MNPTCPPSRQIGGAPPCAVIAYNPASGHYRARRIERLVEALSLEGFAPRTVATRPDGIDIPGDADLVIIAGGDGSLRMVADALGGRLPDIPLAIFPSGTVNLVARELGYSKDPATFAAQLAAGWAKPRDHWRQSGIALHDGLPVMACLSIGPDSAAVAHFSPALKIRIGRMAYVFAFARLLGKWPRNRLALLAEDRDGRRTAIEAEAIFLCRAHHYAGPFTLSSDAWLSADMLQLVVMPKATRLRALAFALCTVAGIDPARFGLAEHHAVRAIDFQDCEYPLQVDGDHVGGCRRVALSGQMLRYCI